MNISGNLSTEQVSSKIIEIEKKFLPFPWSVSQWNALNYDQHTLYVWRIEGEERGFALFQTLQNDSIAHLYKIVLVPEDRGRGIAGDFWKQMCCALKQDGYREIYLEVECQNIRAISFYKKSGFSALRINKNYYSNGQDALIMNLLLA